ncbi:MAG: tRNA (N(6)-L-threonylcarbamoyladenosine(37)-C(2))-methylthiotransferase MtaB [Holosporaceae bacterium]|nr:MAG: tRNA (N(6)-L-threonylcarbamoyladenosine(37)-C(2))-methylthiotransferase MtaB [Holosporaceae bacterium]
MTKTVSKNKTITFGCRLNIYESQVMQNLADQAGRQDTIIVNTCAVTAEAERKAVQSIRKLNRTDPEKTIIVTGCAAQINPDKFLALEGVSQVLGNQDKMKLESFMQTDRKIVSDIMQVKETATHMVDIFDDKTRAFIEIQNGCNHRCTFCKIPYGRGNSRSVPLGAIVEQIQHLVEKGVQEVVFTGVDITSYGEDLPHEATLARLIRRVLVNVPALKRLRLSSIDPVEFDDGLFALFGSEKRLLPHVHISLQAGDDMILRRMKRRHLREDVIAFCKRMRSLRPEVVFGCDIIAGFPTETEDMFQNSLDLIETCNISFLHVFPYSARPDTPAARMPQVEKKMIKDRAKRLRDLGVQQIKKLYRTLQNLETEILIEKDHTGRTLHFCPTLPDQKLAPGTIVPVRITGHTDTHLTAEVIST